MQNIPGYINPNSIVSVGNGAFIPLNSEKTNFIFKFKSTPLLFNILKSQNH
jgi:hypothetical protein